MESSASAPRNAAVPRTVPSIEKLEAMVTPEQVHSATIAKKRRTITRKRTNELNKARSQTPMRPRSVEDITTDEDEAIAKPSASIYTLTHELHQKETNLPHNEQSFNKIQPQMLVDNAPSEEQVTESEFASGEVLKKRLPLKLAEVPPNEVEEVEEIHLQTAMNMPIVGEGPDTLETQTEVVNYPETPEVIQRRHKKKPDSASASNSERQSVISDHGHDVPLQRASSIPKQLEEQIHKLDQFVTTNTQELKLLFQKAKSTVEEKRKELRRRKFKQTDGTKRSQSQPKPLTDEELMEGFRRAAKETADEEENRIRSLSERRYSSGSDKSQSGRTQEPQRPRRKRMLVKNIIKQKLDDNSMEKPKITRLKDQIKCNKIVEVLDPKTSKVIEVKDVGDVTRLRAMDTLKIFQFYSIWEIRREYKKYKHDMNDEYRVIREMRRKCINHILILLIFCGLGGIIFKFIEGSFENFYKCGVKRVKRDFVDLLWIKSHNLREDEWKSLARNRLRVFEEELHAAHEAGMQSYSGQRSWSFLNGIVYCLTIVTTIGYGHLYPTTKTGQALTIVYSLIGIPLFLIILTDFGKLFTRCIKFLWSFVRRLYYTGSCRNIRKTTHAQEIFKGAQMMYEIATFRRPSTFDPSMQTAGNRGGPSPQGSTDGTTAPSTPAISNFEIDDEFNLPISVAILLLVLYIFLGAVLFGIWEGWDFFASFYFVFISMSTIGFGDYVPRHPIFMIVSIVYIVFGLALMTMCINVVQVKLSDTFNRASDKIGATIGLGLAQDDNSINIVPPKPVEMPQVHGSMVNLDHNNPEGFAR